jgi:hypothetical protein
MPIIFAFASMIFFDADAADFLSLFARIAAAIRFFIFAAAYSSISPPAPAPLMRCHLLSLIFSPPAAILHYFAIEQFFSLDACFLRRFLRFTLSHYAAAYAISPLSWPPIFAAADLFSPPHAIISLLAAADA